MASVEIRKQTREDYERFIAAPENRDHILEFIDGEIVEQVTSIKPSQIAGTIYGEIYIFLRDKKSGTLTTTDGCYDLPNGDTLCPDVAFVSKERLPELPPRQSPVPPEFAVEVKSPTDTYLSLREKARRYLDNQVQVVWVVLPEKELIEVYEAGKDIQILKVGDTLDGAPLFPGLMIPVARVFQV